MECGVHEEATWEMVDESIKPMIMVVSTVIPSCVAYGE